MNRLLIKSDSRLSPWSEIQLTIINKSHEEKHNLALLLYFQVRGKGLKIPRPIINVCTFIPENEVRLDYTVRPAGKTVLSRRMGKPTICIGENKSADQLRGNREADQRLCFCHSDSTIIHLLRKSEISSF